MQKRFFCYTGNTVIEKVGNFTLTQKPGFIMYPIKVNSIDTELDNVTMLKILYTCIILQAG